MVDTSKIDDDKRELMELKSNEFVAKHINEPNIRKLNNQN